MPAQRWVRSRLALNTHTHTVCYLGSHAAGQMASVAGTFTSGRELTESHVAAKGCRPGLGGRGGAGGDGEEGGGEGRRLEGEDGRGSRGERGEGGRGH